MRTAHERSGFAAASLLIPTGVQPSARGRLSGVEEPALGDPVHPSVSSTTQAHRKAGSSTPPNDSQTRIIRPRSE